MWSFFDRYTHSKRLWVGRLIYWFFFSFSFNVNSFQFFFHKYILKTTAQQNHLTVSVFIFIRYLLFCFLLYFSLYFYLLLFSVFFVVFFFVFCFLVFSTLYSHTRIHSYIYWFTHLNTIHQHRSSLPLVLDSEN